MIDLVIFDLDGTLIDSRRDIANAVNATRRRAGLEPLDLSIIATYVGHGAPVLIRKALGLQASEIEVAQGLEFFLENYREHALDTTRLYPGVREALDRLRAAGKQLAVLTNKPVAMSRTILEGLGVFSLFFRVYGGNSFAAKKPDPVGVQTLMSEAGTDRDRTLMVGDSAVDIDTARNAGVRACGVTFGFAPQGFNQQVPDLVVDRMEDLAHWVLNSNPVGK